MADGFTILPEFGNSQGANTAVLPQNNEVLNTYFGIQEQRYKDKLFNYKKQQDEIARRAQALNFDTAAMWDIDVPKAYESINQLKELSYKTPESQLESDSEAGQQSRAMEADINYTLNKSKHDKAIYDNVIAMAADPKNVNYSKQLLDAAAKFKANPDIKSREMEYPQMKPDYNLFEVVAKISKDTPTIDETGKAQGIGGGLVKLSTKKVYDPAEIEKRVAQTWTSNLDGTRTHFTEMYNALPQDAPERSQYANAEQYGKDILRKNYPEIKEQTDKTQGINYAPEYTQRETDDVTYIADNASKLEDINSDIYHKTTTDKGKVAYITHVFDDIPITVKNGDGEYEAEVSGVYNIDGELYANPSIKTTQKGKTSTQDLVRITDVKTQLIERKINKQFGSSPNKAKLSQSTFDTYDKIKSKKSSGKSTDKKYTLAEIKAAHAKELAGYTDAEIIEAYKDFLK